METLWTGESGVCKYLKFTINTIAEVHSAWNVYLHYLDSNSCIPTVSSCREEITKGSVIKAEDCEDVNIVTSFSENMNKMYGFEGEVKAKYSANMCELFTEVYNWLPLCHLLNQKVYSTVQYSIVYSIQ